MTECCKDKAYGFKCTCFGKNTAEDDGYGDWLYDQERDRQIEEEMEREENEKQNV